MSGFFALLPMIVLEATRVPWHLHERNGIGWLGSQLYGLLLAWLFYWIPFVPLLLVTDRRPPTKIVGIVAVFLIGAGIYATNVASTSGSTRGLLVEMAILWQFGIAALFCVACTAKQ